MSIDKTYEGENEIFDHTRHYFRIPLPFYQNIYRNTTNKKITIFMSNLMSKHTYIHPKLSYSTSVSTNYILWFTR